MTAAQTMFEKIWNRHVIVERGGNECLLHIDRNFVHEGSFHAFAALARDGRKVRKPRQTIAVADHYAPTRNREQGIAAVTDPEMRNMVELLAKNVAANDIDRYYDLDHPQQGIVHVIGPELGITQPGMVITVADSHTSTHGALGSIAFGLGASQLKQILATQCLWQKKPKLMRITVDGAIPAGVTAKDIILAIIAKIGTAGATGHAIEYAGSAIRALSMEGRLTVCNMSIEAGARCGMVAPDDTTYAYLNGRQYAPRDALWEQALADWRSLPSDAGAHFDREVSLDASTLEPMVTWGTSPEQALMISASVHLINALIMPQVPYDAVADFTPITEIGEVPLLIVAHPAQPIPDIRALVARRDGPAFNWAIAAIGSPDDLVAETFRSELRAPINIIPYKGMGPAISDTLGNQVAGMSAPILSLIAHAKSGRLRALAVTSTRRNSALPDVPTVAETVLPGFAMTSWYGLWGPKGMPAGLVDQLAAASRKGFLDPDIKVRFPPEGFDVIGSTPAEFAKVIDAEVARYTKIVREARISAE